MSDKKMILVQNLTNDDVIYIDNDGGVERRIIFKPQQTQELPEDMIERMSYDIGGSRLLTDYLSVKDDEIRQRIGVPADQIEYDYTKEEVIANLKSNDLNVILDMLDFAPEGIIEMMVTEAVNLPITNRDVMKAISEKTGKNIEMMINNKEQYEKETKSDETQPEKSRRRVQNTQETQGNVRRLSNGTEIVVPD